MLRTMYKPPGNGPGFAAVSWLTARPFSGVFGAALRSDSDRFVPRLFDQERGIDSI